MTVEIGRVAVILPKTDQPRDQQQANINHSYELGVADGIRYALEQQGGADLVIGQFWEDRRAAEGQASP